MRELPPDQRIASINRGARIATVLNGVSLDMRDTPIQVLRVEAYKKEEHIYLIHFSVDGVRSHDFHCAIAAQDELEACKYAVDKVKEVFGANNVSWHGSADDMSGEARLADWQACEEDDDE